jgi:hypothetical protein
METILWIDRQIFKFVDGIHDALDFVVPCSRKTLIFLMIMLIGLLFWSIPSESPISFGRNLVFTILYMLVHSVFLVLPTVKRSSAAARFQRGISIGCLTGSYLPLLVKTHWHWSLCGLYLVSIVFHYARFDRDDDNKKRRKYLGETLKKWWGAGVSEAIPAMA